MKKYIYVTESHLGDYWSRTQNVLINSLYDEYDYHFCCSNKIRINYIKEIFDLIDYPYNNRIFFNEIDIGKRWETSKKTYTKKYLKTKVVWKKKDLNIICYSFDANWKHELKRPPYLYDILNLSCLKNYKLIQLGRPLSLKEIVSLLSVCKIFISVDNGISHISRSVGCPKIFIEHVLKLDRGHPTNACDYMKANSLDEVIVCLEKNGIY